MANYQTREQWNNECAEKCQRAAHGAYHLANNPENGLTTDAARINMQKYAAEYAREARYHLGMPY